MLRRFQKKNGFTLVEVMVAAVMLAVAVISIMGLITDSYGWLRQNQDINIANTLLEKKAEEIKTMSFNDINDPIPALIYENITISCEVDPVSAISKNVTLTATKSSRRLGLVTLSVYMYGGL